MYYRRKLLLAILQTFHGKLNNTFLQKILFLISCNQEKGTYHFIPYRYGCFSFQANQDMHTMIKYNLVQKREEGKSEIWILQSGDNYIKQLTNSDQNAIKYIKQKTKGMSQRDLIYYTYVKHPYYAIYSEIAENILSENELKEIKRQVIRMNEPAFFTMGYEGISLEEYLNKLILNDIRLLCDVRKNPVSRKYGFSKSQLQPACEKIGIHYQHLPELGIQSEKRKDLKTPNDYRRLFMEYENTTLKQQFDQVKLLINLTKKFRRVVITCFEKDVNMCHRGKIAEAVGNTKNWNIPVRHL